MVTCQPNERAVGRDPPLHKTANSPAGQPRLLGLFRRALSSALSPGASAIPPGFGPRLVADCSSGMENYRAAIRDFFGRRLGDGLRAVAPRTRRSCPRCMK